MLSESEREDLAEALVPAAAELVCLVHGDGGRQDVQALVDRLDETQRAALLVVLAGMVDPDRPLRLAAGWADAPSGLATSVGPGDRVVRQAEAVVTSGATEGDNRTVREVGEVQVAVSGLERVSQEMGGEFLDEIAVIAYLSGRRVRMSDVERLEAIRIGVEQQGMQLSDFDRMHGLGTGTTATWLCRMRKRMSALGRPFPESLKGGTVSVLRGSFSEAEIIAIREAVAGGASQAAVAREFGSTRRTVARIASGEAYPEVGGPITPTGSGRGRKSPTAAAS